VLKSIFGRQALLAACCLVSACTILPGLNISEDNLPKGHQYRIEKDPQGNGFKVVNGGKETNLEVVDITPEVIVQERALAHPANLQPVLTVINPAAVPPEYRIGPGDALSVTVWDHPELTNPIGLTQEGSGGSSASGLGHLVAADGTFFYPYIGVIKVSGLTVADLRSMIADGLKKVIASPQVDVKVLAFRAKRIQVFGEVVDPGTVTLDDTPKGVIEAISERHGLTLTASRRRIFLFRDGQTYLVDFASLLSGNHPGANPALQPGDILQVPDKSGDQVFMLGEVAKSAPVIMMQDDMTLTEALTDAGGLAPLSAADSGVLVFRRPLAPGQPPRIFKLDMSNPIGLLLAGEFELQPRDVVYVKRTDFAKFGTVVAQVLPTVTAIYEITDIEYYLRHP